MVSNTGHISRHIKASILRKQLEAGAIGLSVAKISEAETMVEHGINDILIAYSIVGKRNCEGEKAAPNCPRITTVDSLEAAKGLSSVGSPEHPLSVLIEIDCGTHRADGSLVRISYNLLWS